jgi:tRNA nucleotidyltransferase (CCA-adding enzyme)
MAILTVMTPIESRPAPDSLLGTPARRCYAIALPVLDALRAAGHESFLVGGGVRDLLLGREPGDWDVTTSALPDQVVGLFTKTIPTGIKHGTVTVLVPGGSVEVTTYRTEGAYADGRRPDWVRFGASLREDLSRRDFTVNALAFDPLDGVLIDPEDGARDLDARVLRTVGDPDRRFAEDGLRPLRGVRLAAVLEFTIDPGTLAAMARSRESVARVAPERVRTELVKLMGAPRPSAGIELLRRTGLLDLILPELLEGVGMAQNRYHAYDVYEHSLRTCDEAPVDKPRVRWAALLHDLGKPPTRVERDGQGTFYNHQFVGAELADALLERMRFPSDERRAIVHLVREHMFDFKPEWGDAALRRWVARVGVDAVADLFDLRIADFLGNGLRSGYPGYLEEMRRRIEDLLRESQALRVRDLVVDGDDVMAALGIGPGPAVGKALAALLEEVLEQPSANRRDHLLQRLEQWRRERV